MGAKGDGSVFQRRFRRANGTERTLWVCEITLRVRGRAIRKTFYGATQGEVRAKRDAFKSQPAIRQQHDKARLDIFLDRWLESKRTKSPATLRQYDWVISKHIKPFIGSLKLADLDGLEIDGLMSDLAKKGRSTRTIRAVYVVLRAALNRAVRDRLLDSNPVKNAEPPKHRARKIAPLNREQARRFLCQAKHDRLYALYVLALSCGLRQGELFALKWSDIDLRSGKLAVRRQAVEDGSGEPPHLVDYTKTGQDRSIKLTSAVVETLREERKRAFSEGDATSELLFTAPRGGLLRKSNFLRKSFFPLLVRAECPRVRFHDLRHTAATLAFEEGVHPKQVQEMLGHSSVALTLDIYSAFIPTMQDQVAEAMERALFSG